MGRAINEVKNLIEKTEAKLSELQLAYERASDNNNVQAQIDLSIEIEDVVNRLKNLKNLKARLEE